MPGVTVLPTGNLMSIIMVVVSPISRGSITLASDDPFISPLIDPNFIGTPQDLAVMVQAIRDSQQLVSASSFDGFIIEQTNPPANASSDAALEAFIREQTTTVFHPVGTARMGAVNQPSVLTPDLLVKGTVGLRVVDASVLVSSLVLCGFT